MLLVTKIVRGCWVENNLNVMRLRALDHFLKQTNPLVHLSMQLVI